ncbi:hypothetical protein Tco_0682060 [Tanacetum coccineum]|uniref:Uncharacterized protein n=1 Tax=Tanacetum coccineum TaxID=301880 RepID=A0ABQ4XQR7_9ASTR
MPVQNKTGQLDTNSGKCVCSRSRMELHHFVRLKSGNIVDKNHLADDYKIKWFMIEQEKGEDQTVIRNKSTTCSFSITIFSNQSDDVKMRISLWSTEGEGFLLLSRRVRDPDHQKCIHFSGKLCMIKASSSAVFVRSSNAIVNVIKLRHQQKQHLKEVKRNLYIPLKFLGDNASKLMLKIQNCTCMSSAEAEYVTLSASSCSSNVDVDTTSRLWLQLQTNIRCCDLVSHSNFMQPLLQHSRNKAHP